MWSKYLLSEILCLGLGCTDNNGNNGKGQCLDMYVCIYIYRERARGSVTKPLVAVIAGRTGGCGQYDVCWARNTQEVQGTKESHLTRFFQAPVKWIFAFQEPAEDLSEEAQEMLTGLALELTIFLQLVLA